MVSVFYKNKAFFLCLMYINVLIFFEKKRVPIKSMVCGYFFRLFYFQGPERESQP